MDVPIVVQVPEAVANALRDSQISSALREKGEGAMNSVLDAQADFCMMLANEHSLRFHNGVYVAIISGMPMTRLQERLDPFWDKRNAKARNEQMFRAFEKTLKL